MDSAALFLIFTGKVYLSIYLIMVISTLFTEIFNNRLNNISSLLFIISHLFWPILLLHFYRSAMLFMIAFGGCIIKYEKIKREAKNINND